MEAKFFACYETVSQALWLRKFIYNLKIIYSIERPQFRGSFLLQNNKNGSRNKHINIRYLVIKNYIKKQEIYVEYIKTYLMLSYPITKGLPAKVYKDYVNNMGLINSI